MQTEIRRALAALKLLQRGRQPDLPLLDTIVKGMKLAVQDRSGPAPDLSLASDLAALATSLRMRAELVDVAVRPEAYAEALEQALRARNAAIETATAEGVNDANMDVYVRATHEAGLAALALGEADQSTKGSDLLTEAAGWLGEAADGFHRLKRKEDAHSAQLKALVARSQRALRDMR